jgi:hypothetical protein
MTKTTKKRTSLESILTDAVTDAPPPAIPAVPPSAAGGIGAGRPPAPAVEPPPRRPRRTFEEQHKKQSLYLDEPVYEQLRKLAFEERRKMHDYLIEGLDSVFRNRGLPSIAELEKEGA